MSLGTKRVWALSLAAIGIAAAGCGSSDHVSGGSVAKALAANPPASVEAVTGGGQAGVTALLDPRAVPPLPPVAASRCRCSS